MDNYPPVQIIILLLIVMILFGMSLILKNRIFTANVSPKKPIYIKNINDETVKNDAYRKVEYTSLPTEKESAMQLVLMNLKPGEEIGSEIHSDTTQFIRVEGGNGIAIVDGEKYELSDDVAIIIPPGSHHNVVNTGTVPLQLYTIYSPPEHKAGLIEMTKKE